MNVIVFGAGLIGGEAVTYHRSIGDDVVGIIDSNPLLFGKKIYGVNVMSLDKYVETGHGERIVIGATYKYQMEMEKLLLSKGITNYEMYDRSNSYSRERILSYCPPPEMEDVILYHLLKEEENIFYIDVGSNDPVVNSVTKLLYDVKNAHGINIEPQEELYRLCVRERPRDINICAGCGQAEDKRSLFIQGGGSTLKKENVIIEECPEKEIPITTLKKICDDYVPDGGVISFLKVDVEGYEREVLLGADFTSYRPEIVMIESTIPRTMIPTYENWENLITSRGYTYRYSRGVNRYYVADECMEKYDSRFDSLKDVEKEYFIYSVKLAMNP